MTTKQFLKQRYEIRRELGVNFFGITYLADDIKQNRVCVIKQQVIPQGLSGKEEDYHRTIYGRQAKILQQLAHPGYPGIPQLYDYFVEGETSYLVLEYIEGTSLIELTFDDRKPSWQEAVGYIISVCKILHYMHTHNDSPIIFGDVKPASIMLDYQAQVWLTDFFPAEPIGSTEKIAAGSLGYTPLEQWLGEAVLASDIYATGATLHHLVTGIRPSKAYQGKFSLDKIKEVHGQFISIRKVDWRLPKRLDEIISNATAVEPEKRPNACDLQQQLEMLVRDEEKKAQRGRIVNLVDTFKLRFRQ